VNQPWLGCFLFAVGAWAGALALGILVIRHLVRRHGRSDAWPLVMTVAPLVDLAGTWAGAFAAAALFLGRRGFGWPWATALALVALMVTASLYDRAVLMPSLDAAHKRLAAGGDVAKWEGEGRFLWRMAAWGRAGTLAAGAAAAACGLLA